MCGGMHYGEVERLVSVERLSCSRGASRVVEYYGEVEGLGLCREVHSLIAVCGVLCVVKNLHNR